MSGELKPCPFCGSPARLLPDRDGMGCSYVTCGSTPGCFVGELRIMVDDWQRRTPPPATRTVLEMLEGWKQHLTFTGYDVEHFDDCLAEWPGPVTPPPGDGPGHA